MGLFLAGVLVTSSPVLVGFAVGRYGCSESTRSCCSGPSPARLTSGAALSVVNREAGNSLPALGYTGAYAFANVLLTIAGSMILLL